MYTLVYNRYMRYLHYESFFTQNNDLEWSGEFQHLSVSVWWIPLGDDCPAP